MDTDLNSATEWLEANGQTDQAKLIRELVAGEPVAYLVVAVGSDYDDAVHHLCEPEETTTPQRIFLKKDAALDHAQTLQIKALWESNPFAFGYGIDEITSLPRIELETNLRQILGDDFKMPEQPHYLGDPIFPKATKEQKLEVARLFDKLQFYHVVETNIRL